MPRWETGRKRTGARRRRPCRRVRGRPSAVQRGRSPVRRRAAGTGRASKSWFGGCPPTRAAAEGRGARGRRVRRRATARRSAEAGRGRAGGCSRPRGNAEFWTRVDRKMLWWPGHRQTDRFRVCSPASRRVAALRPRFRGAHGLDAGSAHAVQTCPCLTMPHSRPPRCCGRPSVQIDAVSDDR